MNFVCQLFSFVRAVKWNHMEFCEVIFSKLSRTQLMRRRSVLVMHKSKHVQPSLTCSEPTYWQSQLSMFMMTRLHIQHIQYVTAQHWRVPAGSQQGASLGRNLHLYIANVDLLIFLFFSVAKAFNCNSVEVPQTPQGIKANAPVNSKSRGCEVPHFLAKREIDFFFFSNCACILMTLVFQANICNLNTRIAQRSTIFWIKKVTIKYLHLEMLFYV